MPLDPDIAGMLALLASVNPGGASMVHGQPVEAREAFRMFTYGIRDRQTLAPVRSAEDRAIPGPASEIALRVYRPEADGRLATIVFFHGGGYIMGDLDTHDDHARLLCAETGAVVVSVDYRLAPENPFPAGLDDALAATRWVRDNVTELGGDASRIAVAGDSAGGNLAAAVAIATRGEGIVAAQLLIYPSTDFRDDVELHASRVENAEGLFLTAEDMRAFGEHYLGTAGDRHDPRASVLLTSDLSGVAPAVVGTGEYDPLRDEGEAFARELEAAGVKVVLRRYDGLIHGFFGMGTYSPAAGAAAKDLCAELRNLLG